MSDEPRSDVLSATPFEGYDDMTASEVQARLRESSAEDVRRIQEYEATRENPRRSILNYEPPAPAAAAIEEPRGEEYDVAEWKERARSRFGVSPHAIAGALHDVEPGRTLTERDVRHALASFQEQEFEH